MDIKSNRGTIRLFLLLIMTLLVGLFLQPTPAKAGQRAEFSVSAVIPSNQIDLGHTYFDLLVAPNEQQTLTVMVRNTSSKDKLIEVGIHSAQTNENGVVVYDNSVPESDSSLRYPLDQLVVYEHELLVPKETEQAFQIHLAVPAEKFAGMLLGGVTFKEKENKTTSESGTQVVNKFAYMIAIQLQEDNQKIAPNLVLQKVQPSQRNNQNVVTAKLQNPLPVLMKNVKLEGAVYRKGSNTALHHTELNDATIAPNSTIDFGINWENQAYQPGDYEFVGSAKMAGKKWTFRKTFKITKKQSKNYNATAVDLEKKEYPLLLLSLGSAFVILVSTVFIFLKKRQNKRIKHQNQEPN